MKIGYTRTCHYARGETSDKEICFSLEQIRPLLTVTPTLAHTRLKDFNGDACWMHSRALCLKEVRQSVSTGAWRWHHSRGEQQPVNICDCCGAKSGCRCLRRDRGSAVTCGMIGRGRLCKRSPAGCVLAADTLWTKATPGRTRQNCAPSGCHSLCVLQLPHSVTLFFHTPSHALYLHLSVSGSFPPPFYVPPSVSASLEWSPLGLFWIHHVSVFPLSTHPPPLFFPIASHNSLLHCLSS